MSMCSHLIVGFNLLSHEEQSDRGRRPNLIRLPSDSSWILLTTLACDLAVARVYRSLKRGGRLLILEFIPDDERSSAVVPHQFAALELIVTTEGNTFTMK